MDRMYCYLWSESDKPSECKFGERWVKAGKDPEKDIWLRIKESLGVRKDLIKDGIINLNAFWDVSEYSKTVEKYYPHSRMDDFIRDQIGFRKYSTGEIHNLTPIEMEIKVNDLIRKTNQPLPTAGLSQWQYDQAEEVIQSMMEGKRTILAELCARFGKTIWSGAIAAGTETPLTIVASYVLTSFASFKKDLGNFEQFRDLEVVDAGDDTFKEKISTALEENRQVVVFLSMCGGKKRQERIDFLFELPTSRLVFIDEADFGAHTENQAEPFIKARRPDDTVILMTGTNGERACGKWEIDHYICTTYAELLMAKDDANELI